jgi:hypothetical protein
MDDQTLAHILAAFNCDSPKFLKDFPAEDQFAVNASQSEKLFTTAVAVLKVSSNPIISDLMSYVWDVFHHRHILMVVGPKVPSITFGATLKSSGEVQGLVFVPPNWPDMVKDQPLMQIGAIIFTGSQVVDFYNDRITSKGVDPLVLDRAKSYESEYLLLLHNRGATLNEYQKEVLTQNPTGFKTELSYPRKPVVLAN